MRGGNRTALSKNINLAHTNLVNYVNSSSVPGWCHQVQDAPWELERNKAAAKQSKVKPTTLITLPSLHFLRGILRTSTVDADAV